MGAMRVLIVLEFTPEVKEHELSLEAHQGKIIS